VSEIIRVRGQFYILAASALADTQTRVLKQGETFAIFDLYGDIRLLASGEQGLYHMGMRHLSGSQLRLGDQRPLVLGSAVTEDNVLFAVDATNPDMTLGGVGVQRGTLHLFRSSFLWNGVCYQRLRVFNYGDTDLDVDLTVTFESDFADIFEVRGVTRAERGTLHEAAVRDGSLVLAYTGLDDVERRTIVTCSPEGTIGEDGVRFDVSVPARHARELFVSIACEAGAESTVEDYASALVHEREAMQGRAIGYAEVSTSNELFNTWINRSLADLRMMVVDTDGGEFPHAGVPWFASPFGRDAIITAYQLLSIDPSLARGVLAYLAATQADHVDADREAEPGKIIHEQRNGELAAIGAVPFGRYYGSVDATPLFIVLAGEYLQRTNDVAFVESIWPNIDRALRWMDEYGDRDGDGFLEYYGSERGLVQQGWKDSHDSVFHADGGVARPPIALCEVQGYAFWARRWAAAIAGRLGDRDRAADLAKQADVLREAFEAAFWLPDLGTYALALDGDKRPCAVKASNAGHLLMTGITDSDRARSVAHMLMDDAFFSGWGIRTLATSEARYGPITYHNGSIWPHDNSLIAKGMADHGFKESVHRVMEGFLDASESLEFHRLPELYSGFPRRSGQGPIEYPLACAPQAWAAGSVFLFLSACLGLSIDAEREQIVFTNPSLPEYLREVRLTGLRAGEGSADITLHYHQSDDVGVNVTNRTGGIEVVVFK
jgi:glycogen debranching enzyme